MPFKDKVKRREYLKKYRKGKGKFVVYNQQHVWYEQNKPRILEKRRKHYLERGKVWVK